jgi:hypothetical protein
MVLVSGITTVGSTKQFQIHRGNRCRVYTLTKKCPNQPLARRPAPENRPGEAGEPRGTLAGEKTDG